MGGGLESSRTAHVGCVGRGQDQNLERLAETPGSPHLEGFELGPRNSAFRLRFGLVGAGAGLGNHSEKQLPFDTHLLLHPLY